MTTRPARPVEPESRLGLVQGLEVLRFLRRLHLREYFWVLLAEIGAAPTGPDQDQLRYTRRVVDRHVDRRAAAHGADDYERRFPVDLIQAPNPPANLPPAHRLTLGI